MLMNVDGLEIDGDDEIVLEEEFDLVYIVEI